MLLTESFFRLLALRMLNRFEAVLLLFSCLSVFWIVSVDEAKGASPNGTSLKGTSTASSSGSETKTPSCEPSDDPVTPSPPTKRMVASGPSSGEDTRTGDSSSFVGAGTVSSSESLTGETVGEGVIAGVGI